MILDVPVVESVNVKEEVIFFNLFLENPYKEPVNFYIGAISVSINIRYLLVKINYPCY